MAFLALTLCFTCDAQTTVQEWEAKAVEKYPALGSSGSAFNQRFVETYNERRKTDPAFFTNPQWPMMLANELANQAGGAGSAPASPSPAPGPATVPNKMAGPQSTPAKPAPDLRADYEISPIPKSAGLEAAKFRWWAPADTQVRGVLVVIPGRGGDARGMTGDSAWQALATRIQFGILGCMLKNPKEDTATYQFDVNGAVSDLLNKAVDAELAQNGQRVKNPPLAFWGHSAGGNVTQQYASRHANRVVAAVLVRATEGPGGLAPGKDGVPMLIFVGKKDKPEWVTASLANYEKGRAVHAIWSLALNPSEGHEVGKTQALAFAHITAAVALRLPLQTFSSETAKPKQLGKESGWLGDTETFEVAEYNQFKGKKKSATWLANEATAKAWQDYLRGP
jgi:pimeloyl-ACP methyl ester carboxylesterase